MSPFNEGILLYAMRYAIGRQTYAPADVQAAIRIAMPIREAGVREAMIREIEERTPEKYGTRLVGALGDPEIDAPGWLALLADLKAQAAL